MRFQQTIGSPVSCSGVGLHSGQPVTLTLRPAPPNTGIIFVYRNGSEETLLPAAVSNKVPTELCTAISVNGHQVKTIEHLLSALVGMEVDNVYAEVDAGEVPVLDGSASPFVRLIRAAGVIP
ncbi:MAG: UDP-3-O-acyl-N-acetylglucosamine deacetylase, partial [Nitrospira sp.]|nr:UDP-3-O-acyl-N-acetylglucosamine deacetylase [Nitrospira sp.]